ncbi:MAG: NUDIX domain-containing protein [Myxococcota bacterium]
MGEPSLQVVAVAAVVFRDDRILAMRRSMRKDAGAGRWETVSGRVLPDEDPLKAVMREIAEETGLEVTIEPRPVDAYATRRGSSPMTVIVYRADWVSGEVQQSEEHDAHAWWTPDEFARHSTLHRLVHAVRRAAGA